MRLDQAIWLAPIPVLALTLLVVPHRQPPPMVTTAAHLELGSAQIPGTYPAAGTVVAPASPAPASRPAPSHPSPSPGHSSPPPSSPYRNPIGPGLTPARVDMGVDYNGSGPIFALGSGTIVNIYNQGWPGGVFICEQLSDGPDAGKYIYVAENINPLVQAGRAVTAGQEVGYATGGGIETGWAAPPGTGQTMADLTGEDQAGLTEGDPGYYPTGYGVSYSNLIKSLGGPPGIIDGPVKG
jgi:murein DD-endopeptidase MepM/ murein hydrolase activator NlpD